MEFLQTTAACAVDLWAWRIGDPGLGGWAILALYLLAAFAAVRAAGRTPVSRERWFWRAAAVVALALALNKQLDLQAYIFQVGRCAARAGGWYDLRRSVEVAALAGVVGICLVAGLTLVWIVWRSLGRLWPALLALGLMAMFALLRAAGFTHVDTVPTLEIGGMMRLRGLIEVAGALLLLAGTRYGTRPPARDGR